LIRFAEMASAHTSGSLDSAVSAVVRDFAAEHYRDSGAEQFGIGRDGLADMLAGVVSQNDCATDEGGARDFLTSLRLEELVLTGWTAQRREELLLLLDDLGPRIGKLDQAVREAAEKDRVAKWLQTHPGVGAITALAYSLTLGEIGRFRHSRQVVSYLGLNPAEHSSGGRQRLESISKQGNAMLRSLLVEAGQSAARLVPELKRAYQRLKHRKHSSVAKVMVARKLAVRLYWMWRNEQPYSATRMQGSPSHPVAEV